MSIKGCLIPSVTTFINDSTSVLQFAMNAGSSGGVCSAHFSRTVVTKHIQFHNHSISLFVTVMVIVVRIRRYSLEKREGTAQVVSWSQEFFVSASWSPYLFNNFM
jgi:hypothetical protein